MEMSDIIRRAGGLVKLAKAAGRHHATILGWTRVPPQHVRAVAKVTGIPPHELRPDLWDPPAPAESTSETSATRTKPRAKHSAPDPDPPNQEEAA
jgi:DNA-binding transcriptional regulator YdaS (Cro superfamily)